MRIIEKKIFLETIWPAKINGIEHNIGNKFGDSIKNIVFYFVFGLFKIAVIVQQIFFRYKNGYTKDTRFKNLDQVVKAYLFLAIKSIEKQKIELWITI